MKLNCIRSPPYSIIIVHTLFSKTNTKKEVPNMSYTKIVNDGFYPTKVTYDKRLVLMPYASAGVMIRHNDADSSRYVLISYTTPIIDIISFFESDVRCKTTYVYCGAVNYSRTTIKHVSAFLIEYLPGKFTYQQAKDMFLHCDREMCMNVETGELVNYDDVLEFFNRGFNDRK